MNVHSQDPGPASSESFSPEIQSIVRNLYENKTLKRKGARRRLEIQGRKDPECLVPLLASSDQKIRWEAIKTLTSLEMDSMIPVFLNLLNDDYGDIRWLSAEGLIKIGRKSICPTIEKLIQTEDSLLLRESVHHVISGLIMQNERGIYNPLLTALGNMYISGSQVKIRATLLREKLENNPSSC